MPLAEGELIAERYPNGMPHCRLRRSRNAPIWDRCSPGTGEVPGRAVRKVCRFRAGLEHPIGSEDAAIETVYSNAAALPRHARPVHPRWWPRVPPMVVAAVTVVALAAAPRCDLVRAAWCKYQGEFDSPSGPAGTKPDEANVRVGMEQTNQSKADCETAINCPNAEKQLTRTAA